MTDAADYIQWVVNTLTRAVFSEVDTELLSTFYNAVSDAAPYAIQEAALTLLYRLLLLMYVKECCRCIKVG